MTLPLELAFLKDYLEDSSNQYSYATWLFSPFKAPVWKYNFDFKTGTQELNWDVRVKDGSSLTDPKNSDLLNSIKYWLIASTNPYSSGVSNSTVVQYAAFNKTINIIDYLIMNDDEFEISKYGLSALTLDDLKAIVTKISSASSIDESLFNWSKNLTAFAKALIENTDTAQINSTLDQFESISQVTPDDEDEARSLGIDPAELPLYRAALKVNGYIITNKRLGQAPNSILISQEIYKNTLRAKSIDKSAISCFGFAANLERYSREFQSVDVTTGTGHTLSVTVFNGYVRSLYNLGVLHEMNRDAPSIEDLISIKNFDVSLKKGGRFRTLPSQVVFSAVRSAIEFHFDYGRAILDGYLKLALRAKKKDCLVRDLSQEEFRETIGPKLRSLGIEELNLDYRLHSRVDLTGAHRVSKSSQFRSLRANKWLIPLVYVYFGVVQLVVGALTARRVGELKDIKIGEALDSTRSWIIFQNRKSTRSLMGLRSTQARPIEPIGASMIAEIERFQRILNRIGFGNRVSTLFSPPSGHGTNNRINADTFAFNKHLDEFCDYFETSLNREGKRYYIRQHQLRRFFALLFFYSNSFGGLETLQWMLGHTDVRHVWHYITESISGEVLRGAKSQYIAESLHHEGAESFKDLASLLENRYGAKDFTLLDTEELEDYVSELLEEGEIEVEPEFFEDSEGEKFKVIVNIKEIGGNKS